MKIFKKILSILQIILIMAMCILHYFTQHKMGMQRHIMYKNMVFEEKIDPFTMNIFIVIALGIMLIYLLYKMSKTQLSKINLTIFIALNLISILSIAYGKKIFKIDYNIITITLSIITLLQFIKAKSSSI